MNIFERLAIKIRHQRYLRNTLWLWNFIRPVYEAVIHLLGRKGLSRLINGTDLILVTPRHRNILEVYEPDVWKNIMRNLRPGDVFVDVGAHVGLYTIACAKRIGPSGECFLFEPDRNNMKAAKEHAGLNGVLERITFNDCFVSSGKGSIRFVAASNSISRAADLAEIYTDSSKGPLKEERIVETTSLDEIFQDKSVDILKIDVEGYEEKVLEGACRLLSDPGRCPRLIFIEVHPFAWKYLGTTSDRLLALLEKGGYRVLDMDGSLVKKIDSYGEIAALKPVCKSASAKTPSI